VFKIRVFDPGHKFIVPWEILKLLIKLIIYGWLPFKVGFTPEES
jgi:hypothetical protein